ncbi:MAG: Npt1/Npt2 family nucleotide transporter, partial [Thermoanaerobaculia bacterium]
VVVAQIVDLQFNWAVEQATTTQDQRTQFFGNFYSIMSISAFAFQLVFTSRIHRVLGVGFAMRVLPVTMGIGTVALFVAAGFKEAVLKSASLILKVGENGLRYSLDQATRELLFLPIPSNSRLKAKAFIDVLVQRGAKGLAALLLLPVTFGLITVVQAGWISLALIAVWLGVTTWAFREYVQSFRQGLKQGSMDAGDSINLSDIKTLELLVRSLGSSDEKQVLHSLDLLVAHGKESLVPPLLLYHDSARVRLQTLSTLERAGRSDSTELIERRLGDEDAEVRAEAARVLASLHGRDICELMLPRLHLGDSGVRAGAVACIANHGDAAMQAEAAEELRNLLSDASSSTRQDAVKALGAIRDPMFQEHLIKLLYDPDSEVVREAVQAVRRRVARGGYNPLYVPTLSALLQHRRVKHDVREALIAFGEDVLPTLTHYLNDEEETKWVRRALPKTIAAIGSPAAVHALTECLLDDSDSFLRCKVLEAISNLPRDLLEPSLFPILEEAIRVEAVGYLECLVDLHALGFEQRARTSGPRIIWRQDAQPPHLLERLLVESSEDHVSNMFSLLAAIYPAKDVRAAHTSILSDQPKVRSHALEYLDNTLGGALRSTVFAAIGDQPLEKKLETAARTFGIVLSDQISTLEKWLNVDPTSHSDASNMVIAAIYSIYSEQITQLYSKVDGLRKTASAGVIAETAAWVGDRVGSKT